MKKQADDDAESSADISFRVTPAPTVSKQPRMHLRSWRIIADCLGERHLFGLHPDSDRCRMSTAIVDFDFVQRRFVTSSGRVYWMHTEPGEPFEREVLETLAEYHQLVGQPVDVTEPVWQAMGAALQ